MPATPIAEVAALLAESLVVWRLDGDVRPEGGGLAVSANGRSLRVAVASDGTPFPWMVTTAGKQRGVASIAALLRAVRNGLEPDHEASRLRLAPRGVLPS
jgi:hypothetical protein